MATDQQPNRRFVITCESSDADGPRHLAKLLKVILRRLNLKCIDIREDNGTGKSMGPAGEAGA